MSLKLIIICTLLQTVDNCFIVVDCLPYICGFKGNYCFIVEGDHYIFLYRKLYIKMN